MSGAEKLPEVRIEIFSRRGDIQKLMGEVDPKVFGDFARLTRIRLSHALKEKIPITVNLRDEEEKLIGLIVATIRRRQQEATGIWRVISPSMQGRGLIRVLHDAEMQMYRDQGIHRVYTVGETEFGRHSLEHLGFKYFNDPNSDRHLMFLDIKATKKQPEIP